MRTVLTEDPAGPPVDAGGPFVAVCTGHRCAALRRLDGEQDLLGASLRDAVTGGRGGVLVSSPCLGACARGPVVGVGLRDGGSTRPGRLTWLGDLDAVRRAVLAAWVGRLGRTAAPGQPGDDGTAAVPEPLEAAVLGVDAR